MNITVLLLVIAVSAVAHAATVRYDGKGSDSKKNQGPSDFQATKPSITETSSGSSQEAIHLAQLKSQSNQIENARIHNNNKFAYQSEIPSSQAFHSQDPYATNSPTAQNFPRDQSLSYSQGPSAPVTEVSTIQSQQSREQQQFNELSFQPDVYSNQPQEPNQQHFYNIEQQPTGQQQFYNDKEQASGTQQQFFNREQQAPNQDQFYNNAQSREQQQFFGNGPQTPNQEQFYNDKQPEEQLFTSMDIMGGEDQRNFNSRPFQGISNQQSMQISAGKQSTQIQTQGVMQLSAFDNREHPIILPGGTAIHSSPVLVSGLKNLPLLPAMVYNSGSVPSAHAVAISRDPLYKGGAAVRQFVQTPYVRYVYSHIL